jgi:alcohol dehydrogenase class IV
MNIGSPYFLPKVAICDPDLTLSLPPVLTAGTGMDALNQCIEGYLSVTVNPPIDAVALEGVRRALTHIERAVADGSNRHARWHMMMAALEGGISIGKGLGSAHAIANTLGDRGDHHGILVTVAMPSVLRFLENHVGDKMKVLAEVFGLKEGHDVAAAIEQLNTRIGLPTNLKDLGYLPDDLDRAAELCVGSVFNRKSPRVPTHDDYKMIIQDAMG